MTIPADNPIKTKALDTLERQGSAREFADHILRLNCSEGLVTGVLGPWGFGKTSFVNLVQERLKELHVPILEFNPWMFSGTEQLIGSFFTELSAQLKLHDLADIGEQLSSYGKVFSNLKWIPLIGGYLEKARYYVAFAQSPPCPRFSTQRNLAA